MRQDNTQKESNMRERNIDQTRREVWHDDTLNPGSTAARIALEATGAHPAFVQEWAELFNEGDDVSSAPSYAAWLEGAIGITCDRAPWEEDTPWDHVSRCARLLALWGQLALLDGATPRNEYGQTRADRERYAHEMRSRDRETIKRLSELRVRDLTTEELEALAAARRRLAVEGER